MDTSTLEPDTERPRRHGLRSRAARRFFGNKAAVAGLVLVALLVLVAAVGPLLAPSDPNAQSLADRLQFPSGEYLLGTDAFGRDILSRLLYASRVSLFAAVLAVGIATAAGIPLGLLAGYVGGPVDAGLSRVADAFIAIPGLLLAFGIVGILGPGLTNAMIALGIILAPSFFRLSRATAVDLRRETFILAARSLGCSHRQLLTRHILPNAAAPLLVQVSFAASVAIVGEASLSFLGLGVTAPDASWGSMIADGYDTLREIIWPIVPPSFMLMVVVLALFFIGDGLQEATSRGSRHEE